MIDDKTNKNVLLSIIIPTRNRHGQLQKTLSTFVFLKGQNNIELIICDNSDVQLSQIIEDGLKEVIGNFKYIFDSRVKSVIDNFDDGLAHSIGKYVIFIGDDDFILPNITEATEYAVTNKYDCIIYEPDKYYWESCIFAEKISYGPKSLLKTQKHKKKDIVPWKELQTSAVNGFLTIESLPRAYHGIVKRDFFIEQKKRFGKYIIGGSPDISMATCLALSNLRTIFWHVPLSIYGASAGSGGGMTTSKTHCLPLANATFLDNAFVENWDSKIPKYWSEYTVFPASVLYIHKIYNMKPKKFSLASLYVAILINESKMSHEVVKTFFRLSGKDKCEVLMSLPKALFRKSIGKILRLLYTKYRIFKVNNSTIINNIEPNEIFEHYSTKIK